MIPDKTQNPACGHAFLPMVIVCSNWISGWSRIFSALSSALCTFSPTLLLIAGTAFSWPLLSGLNRQYSLNWVGRIGHRVLILTCVGFLVVM